jgi:hypothetical protein
MMTRLRLLVASLSLLLVAGNGFAGQLVITNLAVNSNVFSLGWSSTTDRYIVARSSSLRTDQFQYVGEVLSTNEAHMTNDLMPAFYRIREVAVVDLPDPNLRGVVSNAIVTWYEPRSLIYDIELLGITTLDAESKSIANATGLNGLPDLTYLDISYNQLTHLNVSGCTNLQYLFCYYNQLTNLDVTGCADLQNLYCYNNQLTNLNVSGCTNLQYLFCHNNQLTNLDVTGCTNLYYLYCYGNYLTTLDVSSCTKLQSLWCDNNLLTDLSSLVSNAAAGGLGTGDEVWLSGNPLSSFAQTNQIPYLRSQGVTVYWP